MTFDLPIFLLAITAGAVASVSGFGIGSLLTPFLILRMDAKLAVALVSIPHFFATSLRFWLLRQHIDKKVLFHFGILSAAGGLLGALLNSIFKTSSLQLIFGAILVFAGFTGTTGLNEKFNFGPKTAWLAGAISGVLGGLVGNQGGIRSAALMGFNISPTTFVGTATAIGVIVDTARMPVYIYHHGPQFWMHGILILITSAGVVLGTFLGTPILKIMPAKTFKRIVSGLILLLGIFMLIYGS